MDVQRRVVLEDESINDWMDVRMDDWKDLWIYESLDDWLDIPDGRTEEWMERRMGKQRNWQILMDEWIDEQMAEGRINGWMRDGMLSRTRLNVIASSSVA